MNANPLDQLRDIHLPQAVDWWPLAPGWWILIALVIAVCAYAGYWLYQRYQASMIKRQAIELLTELNNEHQANHKQLLAEYSKLIRRVVISYYPREQFAAVSGKAWVEQLNQLTEQAYFTGDCAELLAQGAYQRQPIEQQTLAQLTEQLRLWILAMDKHRKPLEVSHA